jgi:hypothetical protein
VTIDQTNRQGRVDCIIVFPIFKVNSFTPPLLLETFDGETAIFEIGFN